MCTWESVSKLVKITSSLLPDFGIHSLIRFHSVNECGRFPKTASKQDNSAVVSWIHSDPWRIVEPILVLSTWTFQKVLQLCHLNTAGFAQRKTNNSTRNNTTKVESVSNSCAATLWTAWDVLRQLRLPEGFVASWKSPWEHMSCCRKILCNYQDIAKIQYSPAFPLKEKLLHPSRAQTAFPSAQLVCRIWTFYRNSGRRQTVWFLHLG